MADLQAIQEYARQNGCGFVTNISELGARIDLDMSGHWGTLASQGHAVRLQDGRIVIAYRYKETMETFRWLMNSVPGMSMSQVLLASPELVQALAGEDDDHRADTAAQERYFSVIERAYAEGITDVHIEVREQRTRVRLRRNGVLLEDSSARWTREQGMDTIRAVLTTCLDPGTGADYKERLPLDAAVTRSIRGHEIKLRLSYLPDARGADLITRIPQAISHTTEQDLQRLGYEPVQAAIIRRATRATHGAVLVAGETGSGKSTTLHTALMAVPKDRKIITIEDPVENFLPHATQIAVNSEMEELSFRALGRRLMRADPNVIMLGEIRDSETANSLVQMSITGHLVLATIHTSSAIGVIPRMVDWGLTPIRLADPNLLRAVVYQKLVPQLCPHCRVPLTQALARGIDLGLTDADRDYLIHRIEEHADLDIRNLYVRGTGCEHCTTDDSQGTLGITGRTLVAEVIIIDDAALDFIAAQDMKGWLAHLEQHGWYDVRTHARMKAMRGEISIVDAQSYINALDVRGEAYDYRAMAAELESSSIKVMKGGATGG